jgi:hypothetical protein
MMKFFCSLFDISGRPFLVKIPKNIPISIGELKIEIKKAVEPDLNHVAAYSLVLWKVRY